MGQKESVDEARGSARPLTVAREGRQGGKGVVSLSSRAAPRRQAPGETRARELSGGHRKDGGGSIEGGRWPGHEERPDFEVEKRSSAVGSGGCGTIRRGPFLMARSSLSRALAVASRPGVLQGSRTRWVEGWGGKQEGEQEGEQDEEERPLTVTRSQRARPRNGRLQGWTARAQRACVHSHEQVVWVRARRSRHSRSTDERAVGSGGCGTIQRGPFLMARSSLSRAWAAANLTGVLRGSRTRWVEGKGGEQDEEERTLTVTRSQRAWPRNGRLQGWTTGAQRTCVRSHKRALCDRARRSRHSRSADELAAGRGRRVLAHTASRRHSTGERAGRGSNHPPKGTTVPKGGGRSSPIHDVSHPRAGVTGACIRTRFGGGGGMGMSPLRVDPRHRVAIRLLGHGHIKA